MENDNARGLIEKVRLYPHENFILPLVAFHGNYWLINISNVASNVTNNKIILQQALHMCMLD
jgi:hypothetical protein